MLKVTSTGILRPLPPFHRLSWSTLTRRPRALGVTTTLLACLLLTAGLAAWLLAGTVEPVQGAEESAATFTPPGQLAVTPAAPSALVLGANRAPAEGDSLRTTVVALLDNPAGADGVTVALTAGGTATINADYNLSSDPIKIAAGATAGFTYIAIIDDGTDDDDETIVLNATVAALSLTASPLTLTIKDNDEPTDPPDPPEPTIVDTLCTDTPSNGDYDSDDDGLIEVSCLPQLDAIRWDPDGDGDAIAAEAKRYAAAFPGAVSGMGCPQTGCKGYELTASLDFDTNEDGEINADDAYWNAGQGWQPMKFGADNTEVIFEGNDNTISNLRHVHETEQGAHYAVGLFRSAKAGSIIRNVGLESVNVSSKSAHVGGLVGRNYGTIRDSYVTGTVSGVNSVGALVGAALESSLIVDSHSTAGVTGETDDVGGLVGTNEGGSIISSYATGDVSAAGRGIGGLVGLSSNGGFTAASYATGNVSGSYNVGGLIGYMSYDEDYPSGTVIASYATGNPSATGEVADPAFPEKRLHSDAAGGLIGYARGTVIASYSTGQPSGGRDGKIGGLIGNYHVPQGATTDSYWDVDTSGISRPNAGTGKTTAQLQQPTGYAGIYANWNVDLDDDDSGDDPWDFGNACQYPVLKYGSLDPDDQRAACTPPQRQQAAPNRAPTVAAAIADATIVHESGTKQVSLSGVFDDADGDNLSVSAVSSDEATATGSVSSGGSGLTVTARLRGTATITVTADDGKGGTAGDSFTVTVKAVPTVSAAIADVSGLEAGSTQDVSLAGVFRDADGDALTITAASGDEAKATVAVSADQSKLTLSGVAQGSATVTVTAEDSDGNRVSNPFEVSVVGKYAGLIAQMYQWREDPQWRHQKSHTDRWDRALLAFGETVADSSLTPMTAAQAQALADQDWGTRWVPVAAALREIEANRQQQAAPNQAPTVSAVIGDATIVNQSGTRQVSLSGVFSDADSDALTITAASSDEAVTTVSVATDYSALTVSARARGTATITVTANDGNGGTVEDSFTVTVKAAPAVASALADVSGLETGSTQEVFLSGVFSDADGDSLVITAASSDEAKATVSVASDGSRLTLTGVAQGTVTITVTARDSDGNRVIDAFDVSVAALQQPPGTPNRAPTVSAAIADATIVNESGTRQVSRSVVFDDADGDALTISAASSDRAKATVSVAADYSSLTVTAQARGTAVITVTANDGNGGTVSDTFTVTVKAAPVVASAIADVNGLEAADTQEVSLSGVFRDADGDALTISAASSDEARVTVTVSADQSTLTLAGVAEGTTTVTVTAQDSDGNAVSDAFQVEVVEAEAESEEPSPVTNLSCDAQTDRVTFRWDAPQWSGVEVYAYDYIVGLPDGKWKLVRLQGHPVVNEPGDYQAGKEASITVRAVYENPDGSEVSSEAVSLTCTVAE